MWDLGLAFAPYVGRRVGGVEGLGSLVRAGFVFGICPRPVACVLWRSTVRFLTTKDGVVFGHQPKSQHLRVALGRKHGRGWAPAQDGTLACSTRTEPCYRHGRLVHCGHPPKTGHLRVSCGRTRRCIWFRSCVVTCFLKCTCHSEFVHFLLASSA